MSTLKSPLPFSFLLCVFLLLAPALSQKMYGVAYGRHGLNNVHSAANDQSLQNAKNAGVNYLHLTLYAQTSSKDGQFISRTYNAQNLRVLVGKAKKLGLKIFFKPVVECTNGDWRGFITGKGQWWQSYGDWIQEMARLAEELKIDMFAVGSEYRTLDTATDQWRTIIKNARQAYKGTLTYVANHDSYQNVKFFDDLDKISLAGYFRLVEDDGTYAPSLEKTKQLWEEIAKGIFNWRQKAGLGSKQVFIGEVGFQARGNGMNWRRPFDFLDKSPINEEEQNQMYEAYLSVMYGKDKSWLDGVFLWLWEDNPNPPVRETDNYSPQNRPAEKTMSKYYKGTTSLPMKASGVSPKTTTTSKTVSSANIVKLNDVFKGWKSFASKVSNMMKASNFKSFQMKK